MIRDHLQKLIVKSPHVEEFEVPPALHILIQTNFGRRMISKSSRRIKVDMSHALKRGP
jgi:hypothetical protein